MNEETAQQLVFSSEKQKIDVAVNSRLRLLWSFTREEGNETCEGKFSEILFVLIQSATSQLTVLCA